MSPELMVLLVTAAFIGFLHTLLGPCEPLIPLLMYPAAKENFGGLLLGDGNIRCGNYSDNAWHCSSFNLGNKPSSHEKGGKVYPRSGRRFYMSLRNSNPISRIIKSSLPLLHNIHHPD